MATISIGFSDPAALSGNAAISTTTVWRRVTRWFQSTWCVINGGHYKVLHTAPNRLALRCVACGHMSPGWVVGSPRLARAVPPDPERLRARRAVIA